MLFNEENIENLLIKLFLVKQLEKQFLLSTRENNKYKISHRNTVAIIQKTDVALILITAYCFEKYDYNIENIPLKISIAINKENRFKTQTAPIQPTFVQI